MYVPIRVPDQLHLVLGPGLPQPRLYVPCPRWREGKFQEVVEAEYVLLEMNGLFTYTYSLTAGTAGCSAQPQNWTTITQMAGNTAPFSWDREVRPALLSSPRAGDFRSCAVCAGSRLDLFRLLLTEHQRPQGLLTAAWVSHGSWRLGRGSALPRLGAELELRRSGSSLGPSQ